MKLKKLLGVFVVIAFCVVTVSNFSSPVVKAQDGGGGKDDPWSDKYDPGWYDRQFAKNCVGEGCGHDGVNEQLAGCGGFAWLCLIVGGVLVYLNWRYKSTHGG